MIAIYIGVCFCAPNFSKMGYFLIVMWRVNDFKNQNSGRLPSWIFEIFSLCHMTFFGMLFCIILQKKAEIGRSLAELCPKTISKMAAVRHIKFYF